jgi:integrase
MASLQARHRPTCAIVVARIALKAREGKDGGADPWSTFAAADKKAGGCEVDGELVHCTCSPTYWLAHRDDETGKLRREDVGHNRQKAERKRVQHEAAVDEETYVHVAPITFATWADQWLAGADVKATTRSAYQETLTLAKRVFGHKKVGALRKGDILALLAKAREDYRKRRPAKEGEAQSEVSPATLARHLRQLSACLQAAIPDHAKANPIRSLDKTSRPKVASKRPSYFTDAELVRLWPELVLRPVYLALCKTAVLTGLRFGELAGLEWGDVELVDRVVHVRRTHDKEFGTMTPKSGEERTIDLTPQAAQVLEDWLAASGGADVGDHDLVFEREEGGHVDDDYTRRLILYRALERAGIDRVGEGGRARTFHSFRHTFARVCLENGAGLDWVRDALGHSSVVVTETYGHWSRAGSRAQAERLAGAFPV